MKQYVIDELRLEDYHKLKAYLDTEFGAPAIRGVYWLPIQKDLLTETQASHHSCQPFYFALDLEESMVSCEFLVRTKQRVKCDCMGYADENQRNWVINVLDAIFEKLGIMT